MKTTLNQIRAKSPCADGWKKLLTHLGKTQADDEALSIITILDSNGLDDALWCLRAVTGHDREIRLYAVWCARQVQHLMTDKRSLDALDVSERFANGLATDEELTAARAAAWAAEDAEDAEDAADAAWSAEDAAEDAARAAARAAWAASAASLAASAASAASDASDASAAASAASDAARAASDAVSDAVSDAAWAAAFDASDAAQEKRLREACAEIDAAIAQRKETIIARAK